MRIARGGDRPRSPHRYHRRLDRLEGRRGGGDPPAECSWEGADAPLVPSIRSTAYDIVNQLCDPAIHEVEGRDLLFYAVTGESGLAIAELVDD